MLYDTFVYGRSFLPPQRQGIVADGMRMLRLADRQQPLRHREEQGTGQADTVTKAYMRGNAVFADAFNYLLYDGRAVIDPHNLKEIDPTEITLPFGARDGKENRKQKEEAVQKYRDLLKNAVVMEDGKTAYVLLGIENQTDIHYAMPVKNAIYDALQYGKQVSDIAAKHRADRKEKKSEKKVSDGEYLSGFYKEDRLVPVITLVIHFGAEEWDGPMSLHEMMEIGNPELLKYIQDYRIHLIDPSRLTEEELEKFSTSLREVLGYIKYSEDGKKILAFVRNNPGMMMDADAARVIRTVTNTPVEIPEEEVRVDMCKGIEELMEDSRKEGRKEGEASGALRKAKETASALAAMGLPTEQIASAVGTELEVVKEWILN